MKMQWEYDLVEKPFCRHLEVMGWEWLKGDPDLPESTERSSSREVLLKNRLAEALRRINRRAVRPWLDDSRIAYAVRDLEQAAGNQLSKINRFDLWRIMDAFNVPVSLFFRTDTLDMLPSFIGRVR